MLTKNDYYLMNPREGEINGQIIPTEGSTPKRFIPITKEDFYYLREWLGRLQRQSSYHWLQVDQSNSRGIMRDVAQFAIENYNKLHGDEYPTMYYNTLFTPAFVASMPKLYTGTGTISPPMVTAPYQYERIWNNWHWYGGTMPYVCPTIPQYVQDFWDDSTKHPLKPDVVRWLYWFYKQPRFLEIEPWRTSANRYCWQLNAEVPVQYSYSSKGTVTTEDVTLKYGGSVLEFYRPSASHYLGAAWTLKFTREYDYQSPNYNKQYGDISRVSACDCYLKFQFDVEEAYIWSYYSAEAQRGPSGSGSYTYDARLVKLEKQTPRLFKVPFLVDSYLNDLISRVGFSVDLAGTWIDDSTYNNAVRGGITVYAREVLVRCPDDDCFQLPTSWTWEPS